MWNNYYRALLVLVLLPISFVSLAGNIINMSEGDSQVILANKDVGSVFVSDPKIADYQVIEKKKVIVYGKKIGQSSVMVFDRNGHTLANKKLIVNKSLDSIKQYISVKYPDVDVDVFNIGEQVVLSGTVSTEQEKDEINNIVGQLLDKDDEKFTFEQDMEDQDYEIQFMERTDYKGIVNNIEVATTKQVNVKISIAEVSQSFLQDIGIQYGTDAAGVFIQPLTHFSSSDIMSVITAIGSDTVGQILAEPNLSVVSGESASFLVGGELPVVTTVNNSTNVMYKEYGVRLELMAKVKKDDKITLSLVPEVSSLDIQYENDSYDLPALKTRRARTTVELGDGQSFVLGGLLSSEDKESLQKIPFIGDIPILGALFRGSSTKRNKTELLIVATVNLVKPIHSSQIQLPMMRKTTTLNRFFALEDSYVTAGDKWAKELLAIGGFKK
ncbi:type II and III secretion system protein family protein [Aliivibrio fischeri]|uniref:General secretion pathway protein D n=2 Tax=Aliivibrio fischeri TaxID=668 RepID=Q5E106_ALIF1|nr:pilus assembly protein N-terminal domain-containing protein [Aliivibrio fischeri]AAW87290.1 general secretion pathway protein D [Aliivibrio fischeri ES114]KLU78066.1 general secretion pathway protein GspD [Aliivibrio fischeri]MBP3139419.1 pilus assembly protein N-terminal domain-containing protein [Aliivibrio fischeri]MBP3155009.1 pilus assembly protein N-terminal domain-containing protein [Aliivibrio fischeri]MCE7535855.1 pilus assembly protein N-terminal domain-containing protein [Aliivib